MTDNELLKAMSDMMDQKLDEKLQPITIRLDRVDERLDKMDDRFDKMDERLDKMDERLDKMDERLDKMDDRFGKMDDRFDRLEALVAQNYDKTLEFYDAQQEANTEMADRLITIQGQLDMHTNQIARNTADIRRYK